MSNNIKLVIGAEIDKVSITNMKSQLEGLQKSIGKLKLEVDTGDLSEVTKILRGLESQVKPMKLEMDTTKAKSSMVDINGEMQRFYTTSVKTMQGANGETDKYVTTMHNADRTLKQVTTSVEGLDGKFKPIGNTITQNVQKPIEDMGRALKDNLKLDNTTDAMSNKLSKLGEDFGNLVKPDDIAKVEEMMRKLDPSDIMFPEKVKEINAEIKNMSDGFTRAKQPIVDMGDALKDNLKLDNTLGATTKKLEDMSRQFGDLVKPEDVANIESMMKALDPSKKIYPNKVKEMNDELKRMSDTAKIAKKEMDGLNNTQSKDLWGQSKEILDNRVKQSDELKKMGAYYKELEKSTSQANATTETFGQTMQNTLKKAVGWVSLTMAVRMFAREVKKGVEMVKEIDSAMVELKKVTSATDEEYSKFMDTAFQTGKGLARTGTEVINATADFARMGFEMKGAAGLAAEALLMLNVGDGIESLDDATSSLISTLRGFKVASEDSVGMARTINDAFNEVANNFAIDTGSIASATKRVSAVMHEAGNDIYETTGLITGAYEVMQNPEKVSSGLNIITQRLQAVKQVGGELTPTIQKAFDEIGLSVLDSNNEMKSTYQILGEVASIYPTLTDLQQKYVAEAMSGKRQSAVLKAIVGNWEQVEAATEAAKNSLGSAQVENMVYLDSIEGKMQGFTSSMQEFWSTAIDSDAVKSFVDMGTSFVGTATSIVDSLSGIQMVLLPLIPLLGVKFVSSAAQATKSMQGFEDLSFAQTFKTLIPGLRGTMTGADGTRLAFSKLTVASMGLKAALFLLPVAITAIVSAEKRRKQAMLDTVEAFKEQKEMSNTVSGLVDRYRELSSSTEEVTKNSGALATIKERLKKLMPESAAALDDETLSYKEQADVLNEINALNEQQSMDMALDTISKYGNDIDKLTEKLESYKEALKSSEKGVEMYQKKIKNGEELTSGQLVALQQYREGQESAKEGIENTTAAIDVWHDSMDVVNGKTGEITTQTELFAAVLELKLAKSAGKSADEIERLESKISRGKDNIEEYGVKSDDTARKISDFGSAVEDADGAVQDLERTMSPEESHLSSYAKQAVDAEKNISLLTDTIGDLNEGKETSIQKEIDLIQVSDEFIGFSTMSKKKQLELLQKYIKTSKEAVTEYKEEAQAVSEGTALMQASFDEATRSAEESEAFWNNLDLDTKELIIETSELDEASEDFHELLSDWLANNPEEKELVVSMMGEKYVSDNINELGDKWENLSDEEKEFLVSVIGKGLDEFEDFEKEWAMLNPEVKKFLAEQAGLEDVQDADYETMQSWAKEPLMKLFLAQQDGLENVRIERNLTDGVWEVTIDDVTYRTIEEGGNTARTSIQKTLDLWNPIPRTDTKKTIFESVFRTIGAPPKIAPNSLARLENRWTGDDNFKGGLSYVGERGRELLIYPDGSHSMTGQKAELRNLPRGTKIYNNRDTENIMSGNKVPEFNRADRRVKGDSNTPGFASGNTKPKKTPKFAGGNAKAEDRAIADIYERVNRQLEKQGNLIKRNNLLQERAEGNLAKQIVLLKEQLQLNKDEEKLLKNKQSLQRKERNDLERHLSKAGFKFKGKGDDRHISNLGNISGKNKSVEEKFNQFNDLSFNLIPSLNADILSIQNDIANSVSKGSEKQTRLNNEVLKNNHLLSMNAIYRERATDDLERTIELIKEEIDLQTKRETLLKSQADIHREERRIIAGNLKKQGFEFEGVGDFQVITNEEVLKGKSKEIEEAFNRYNEIQIEVIPNIKVDRESIKNDITSKREDIIDVVQKEIDKLKDLNDELETTKEKIKDLEKTLADVKFDSFIGKMSLGLSVYSNEVSLLQEKLATLHPEDFYGRMGTVADLFAASKKQSEELREEFAKLAGIKPTNPEEANKLASAMKDIQQQLKQSSTNMREYQRELDKLRLENIRYGIEKNLIEPFKKANEALTNELKIVEHNIGNLQEGILADFPTESFLLTPEIGIDFDSILDMRTESEKQFDEQKSLEEQIQKLKEESLAMQLAEAEKYYQEEMEKALTHYSELAEKIAEQMKEVDKVRKDANKDQEKEIATLYKNIEKLTVESNKLIKKSIDKHNKEVESDKVGHYERLLGSMKVEWFDIEEEGIKVHNSSVIDVTSTFLTDLYERYRRTWDDIVNKVRKSTQEILQLSSAQSSMSAKSVQSTQSSQPVPKYKGGTKGHKGGVALVGEEGQELGILPSGKTVMLGKNGAELVDLPEGTQVVPNAETKDIVSHTGNIDNEIVPKYAKGTKNPYEYDNDYHKKGNVAYINPENGNTSVTGNFVWDGMMDDKYISKGYIKVTDPDIVKGLQDGAISTSGFDKTSQWEDMMAGNASIVAGARPPTASEKAAAEQRLKDFEKYQSDQKKNTSVGDRYISTSDGGYFKEGSAEHRAYQAEQAAKRGNSSNSSNSNSSSYGDSSNNYGGSNAPQSKPEPKYTPEISDEFVKKYNEYTKSRDGILKNIKDDQEKLLSGVISDDKLEEYRKSILDKIDKQLQTDITMQSDLKIDILENQQKKMKEYLDKVKKEYDSATTSGNLDIAKEMADEYNAILQNSLNIEREIQNAVKQKYDMEFALIDKKLAKENKSQAIRLKNLEILKELNAHNYDGFIEHNEAILKSEQNKIGLLKESSSELQGQLDKLKVGSFEWNIINDRLESVNSSIKDSTLSIIKQNKGIAENKFDKTIRNEELSIFDGRSQEEATRELEKQIAEEDKYVTGLEKELTVQKMITQARLDGIELTDEEMNLLSQSEDIEKSKLEQLEKQLSVRVAEQKLENIRNQKTIKQLQKNEDGTWEYKYVADKKAIEQAEIELKESQLDLHNWERDLDRDKRREDIDLKSEYLDRLRELAQKSLESEYDLTEDFYKDKENISKDFLESVGESVGSTLEGLGRDFEDLLESLNKFKTPTVKSGGTSDVKKFNTGGYTKNSSGLAWLDEKEIVLNKQQTTSFEKLVNAMPSIMKVINTQGKNMFDYSRFKPVMPQMIAPSKVDGVKSENSTVNIKEVIFPNAQNVKDIQDAILGLPGRSVQRSK